MSNYYTENLADFGVREIEILRNTLDAWLRKGLPDNFYDEGVKPAMNRASGYVFLTNADYQVAMLNGESLDIWHTLPWSGDEGFLNDFDIAAEYHLEDADYLTQHGLKLTHKSEVTE